MILGKAVELTKGLDSDDRMMDDGEATHNLQKIVLFSLCHLFWKTPDYSSYDLIVIRNRSFLDQDDVAISFRFVI